MKGSPYLLVEIEVPISENEIGESELLGIEHALDLALDKDLSGHLVEAKQQNGDTDKEDDTGDTVKNGRVSGDRKLDSPKV